MKYIVLFGVLLVVYLVWRHQRRTEGSGTPPAPAQPAALAQDMVRCPVCALHLPRAEAVAGGDGRFYCSPEHRVAP
ncbi:PP0621 family protein [uncultured Ramlibacter sp.]|uniref:PP0621 family protein n=1 Tax=uncultured Ramlibacter sp. TaxID=260755 RepID=UPI0026056968|nr:PP0621 family protein [uncultured Ramlibacter sp.]